MEMCPYKQKNWKRNMPANIILIVILVAIALLYYLYYDQERISMDHEKRIFDYENALQFDGGCK